MDRCSFRDIGIALSGARARQQDRWQHTLAIAQAVYNWGGPRSPRFRPQPLDHMFKKMFPDRGEYRRVMTLEEYHERMAAYEERRKEYVRKQVAELTRAEN